MEKKNNLIKCFKKTFTDPIRSLTDDISFKAVFNSELFSIMLQESSSQSNFGLRCLTLL